MAEIMSESPIPKSVLRRLPVRVRDGLGELSREKQDQFLELYHKSTKSILIAYLRCFIIPYPHYAYLGHNLRMVIYLLSVGGLGIWTIIDLFRIPGLVREYNRNVARIVLAEVRK